MKWAKRVIDQYQVSTDPQQRHHQRPQPPGDPEHILRLLGQVSLDGFLFSAYYPSGRKAEITSRVAVNFVGWEGDHALFDRELEKVVRALRADEGGRERPPRAML